MRHDAIVIGGSFAGLSAALYIARARRSVCVIDTGLPRNRFAQHSHGFFAHDGSAPTTMLATARSQVAAYPTVSFVDGEAAFNGGLEPDDELLAELTKRHIAIEPAPVKALHGDGSRLTSMELVDGKVLPADALYVAVHRSLVF